jgi:hypothetical protein
MPETIDAPPQTEGLNPDLQALLDRVMPKDDGSGLPDEPKVEPAAKPTAPEPKVENAAVKIEVPKAEKSKADDFQSRLAPDLTKTEPEPAPAAVEIDWPEELPGNPTKKAQSDYKKWRGDYETALRKIQTLETAKPAAKAEDSGSQAIIDQQKQQIAEMSTRLERQDVRSHPRFQQAFVIPRNQMMLQAQEIVKEMGGDPDALEKAMSLSGRNKVAALDEIVAGVDSTVQRDKLGRLLDAIESKDREMENVLKDSKGAAERLSQQEKIDRHQMIEQQTQQLKTMLGAARKDLADNLKLEVLHKVNKPDFKWWDDQVDEIDATAHSILFEGTPDKMAVAAILAASAGPLRSMWQAERKARMVAEERLAAIEEVEPKLGARPKPKEKDDGDVPEDADFATAVISKLRARK